MTELPESITRLQGLLKLQIEYNGKTSIRCAPMQISTLPCWTNTEKPYRCNWKISESLQKLKVSKFHHESIRDVSSLISKWRACNSIDLSSNEIATLPDSMSTLTDLCHINLSRNSVSEESYDNCCISSSSSSIVCVGGHSGDYWHVFVWKITEIHSCKTLTLLMW
eukprot:TRINITY_DN10732_c0_g1_i11.p1 TRINITY_DN10732_c0_g1~~TRINITY_DN10732_c0_g1_i11.p1  ORF type:complete len:166 (+),score=25.93 TRINITY_DN10732_c0_g1_i11:874-1371(+)